MDIMRGPFKTWYFISFSACSLSSSLDSLKNLFPPWKSIKFIRKKYIENYEVSLTNNHEISHFQMLLGKSLKSNVVSVKVGKHGVVHIGNVVFHTVIENFNIKVTKSRVEKKNIRKNISFTYAHLYEKLLKLWVYLL